MLFQEARTQGNRRKTLDSVLGHVSVPEIDGLRVGRIGPSHHQSGRADESLVVSARARAAGNHEGSK